MIELFPSRSVFLELFGFGVHWYGIMYLLGFVTAWYLLPKLQPKRGLHLTADDWSHLLSWAVLGVIVGGRLGFVLFYEPGYFLRYPLEVFAVWRGGMASHGGFIGVILALLWALRDRREEWWRIADIVVIPVAVGLAFGRFGNFINQELYGTVTTLPWGISIPGVEGLRHPTQLYAVAKDLFIAAVCYWHLSVRPVYPGKTAGLFFMLYGLLRFIVEYFRIQDYGMVDLGIVALSPGQLLTIPVFILGVLVWWWAGKRGIDEGHHA